MTRHWIIENYMVAFLDVLGQSDEVLKLQYKPTNKEEEKIAASVLENTAGYILDLREAFISYSQAIGQSTGLLDRLPPNQREQAETMRRVEAEFHGLSDSILITVPLTNDNEHCTPMNSIYPSLFGICGMFIPALVSKKPFRGGVDIGWGVRLTQDELYGSALVKAVKLESKAAEYPRVIIGNSLLDYINQVEAFDSCTIFSKFAKMNAVNCKSLITSDFDEYHILDVIGSGFQSVEHATKPQWVEQSYEFIVKTHERFGEIDDTKHHSRYGLLRNYFESRLHLWNIQPIKSG